MRKIIKKGKAEKLEEIHFKCTNCGEEWITDEWMAMSARADRKIQTMSSECDNCGDVTTQYD